MSILWVISQMPTKKNKVGAYHKPCPSPTSAILAMQFGNVLLPVKAHQQEARLEARRLQLELGLLYVMLASQAVP